MTTANFHVIQLEGTKTWRVYGPGTVLAADTNVGSEKAAIRLASLLQAVFDAGRNDLRNEFCNLLGLDGTGG